MTLAQWTAEMTKMQQVYGAPISGSEVNQIGAYLAVTYGSAKATDAEVMALTKTATAASGTKDDQEIDVRALLNANACLGCHAIDKKVVGLVYHDVAVKYKGDADARAKLVVFIQQGGAGKWGEVAMPPMGGLSDAQAEALANFVLLQ